MKCHDGDDISRFGIKVAATAVGILLICATLAAQKVTTNFDKNFDFARHRRYAWGQNHLITRQGKQSDELIDQKIVQDVNRNLAEKGFVEDFANPDFFISYEAGAGNFTGDVEGFHASPAPRLNETQGRIYGIPQNVWYSIDGHIVFHLVDAKSDQPAWTATATKKIATLTKAGYLMVHQRTLLTLLYPIAMALHFLAVDYSLEREYGSPYDRSGRWLLAAAILAGGFGGILKSMPEELLATLLGLN